MSDFTIRFWGVRGSLPCPGPATKRYGGNTPCVEVRCGGRLLILDGGTGLRELGDALVQDGGIIDADLLLTHCHYDHVIGIPFFAPFFLPQHRFRMWAGNLLPDFQLKPVMQAMMSEPLFPIGIDSFKAHIDYRDFRAGETVIQDSDLTVRTIMLDHPGGATGYRIDYRGRSVAYLTDNEGRREDHDKALVAFSKGADLVIYDTTYTEAEIDEKKGWGHSTWQDGMRLAVAAGAKTFCLFHHAPEHDDAAMDALLAEARSARPGTIAAIEGEIIRL
ncbi:MBL fold metallo-hydrolase [Pseudorhodoplanes sp.]|uniref:MBL fold metallo-hydrolase n=1 Tax=Pseudorhodoplanes sp. TaxID=1934341 RepID=UPI002D1907CE|nr:MBL fold metallo-hydrolase [Pseudorhodoplanes sp.]HWV53798.1 MBL fold metallo-hydrolase [Pseudorhodoplanes sp.]